MNALTEVHDHPLIRLRKLSKIFDIGEVETHALSAIDLDINRGEFVTITGPSGCGKSTLLSVLGLLDAPSSGDYWINNRNVSSLKPAEMAQIRNREVGFIFQSFNLIADLTVEENVLLPLTYRSGSSADERRSRARESLEKVGMSHRLRHYPAQLSGGQQQRVAVARALVGNPSILLADEPTGNLDSLNGESVMKLLEELHRNGSTLCMVTHDPAFCSRASRTINLLDGKIAPSPSPVGATPKVTAA